MIEEYDDSPWTPEELQALAWEAGRRTGWEEMDEYDVLAEPPQVVVKLLAEFEAWSRASAIALELVERLAEPRWNDATW